MPRSRAALPLAALAPAAVLACDPGGFYPFGPAKGLVVPTLVLAGFALLLARRPLRYAGAPTIAAIALAAAMAAAAVVGVDPLYAWIGTPERHLGAVAWVLLAMALVAGQSLEPRDGRLVLQGVVVAACGLGATAVADAVGAWPGVLDAGDRLAATLGSPAYLGAAASLLLPVALGVAADTGWRRSWRVAAALGAALLVVAALGSGARAAWVGLALGAVATLVAQRARLLGRRTIAAIGACALVALGAVAVVTPAGGRVLDTFDADAPGGQGRLDEWRIARNVLAEHPLTGVGPEGYRVAFGHGADAAYEAEHGREPTPDRAHSAPLDVALAGGPLALASWLALLVLLGGYVRRALRSDRPWLVGTAAGLVAYVTGQLFLFPLAELEPIAALLAGLVVVTVGPAASVRARVAPRVALVAVGALAVVTLVAGAFDLAADRAADEAAEAERRGDTAGAVDHAQRAVDLRPDILRNHLLLASTLEADQRGVVAALAAVDDGLDVSPGDPVALRRRAELLVERAAATLVPADIDAADRELVALLEDDPNNSVYWILVGVTARLDGDPARARAAFQRASELVPADPRPPLALVRLELEQLYLLGLGGDGTG